MYNVYRCNKHIYIIKVHPKIIIFIFSGYTNVFDLKKKVCVVDAIYDYMKKQFYKTNYTFTSNHNQ